MSTSTRRLEILRAIVDEYVATQEPVGSKAIADRHELGVSPATIRNEMALLEEEGLITAPHTSAGRIPTDRGYRVFVDKLAEVKPLSAPERRAIESFLEGALDLDDVVGFVGDPSDINHPGFQLHLIGERNRQGQEEDQTG